MGKIWTIPEELYEDLTKVRWTKEKVQYFFDYNNLNRIVVDLVNVPFGNDNQKRLKVVYNCGDCGTEFLKQEMSSVVNTNHNCPNCSRISASIKRKGKKLNKYPKVSTIEEFQILLDSKIPNKWIVFELERKGCKLFAKVICKDCGGKTSKWLSQVNLGRRLQCVNCNSKLGKQIVELCNEIHKNQIECFVELDKRYLRDEKFKTRCKICGIVKDDNYINNLITMRSGCKSCNQSKGEKYVKTLLQQLNLNFIIESIDSQIQYNLGFCNRYDFYIESLNLLIEVDGSWHRNSRDFDPNAKSLEEVQKIDKYKDEMALELGYNLIRLIYNDEKPVKIWKKELELQLFEDLELYGIRKK